MRWLVILASILILTSYAPGQMPPPVDPDEQLLKDANLRSDRESLLNLIRLRTPFDGDVRQMDALLKKLASEQALQYEPAARQIIALGRPALPGLRQILPSASTATKARSLACIRAIQADAKETLTAAAAVRLLLRAPTPEAVDVLLRYLPYAAGDDLQEEIWFALDRLATSKDRLHPAIVTALDDALPARRALAACLVGRSGNAEQRLSVAKMLRDSDPVVRLRAAQGLFLGKDKSGLPTLIDLLNADLEIAWQAEELLRWTAGNAAPDVFVGAGTVAMREPCRKAWQSWLRENGPILDLTLVHRATRRPLLVLVIEANYHKRLARVTLRGGDGKARWELQSRADDIWDAELLPGGRVLLAETSNGANAHELSERGLDGTFLWQTNKACADGCQRLANGNTFVSVVNGMGFRILDPAGKELMHRELTSGNGQFLHNDWGCRRLPNGRVLASIGDKGVIGEFDGQTGRELMRIEVAGLSWPSRVEALANGHYLVAAMRAGVVLEIDRAGKVVWEHELNNPTQATRLRDGRTLVAVNAVKGGLVELDRGGRRLLDMPTTADRVTNLRVCLPLVRFGFHQGPPPEAE